MQQPSRGKETKEALRMNLIEIGAMTIGSLAIAIWGFFILQSHRFRIVVICSYYCVLELLCLRHHLWTDACLIAFLIGVTILIAII